MIAIAAAFHWSPDIIGEFDEKKLEFWSAAAMDILKNRG
jgi:hypothetical protein